MGKEHCYRVLAHARCMGDGDGRIVIHEAVCPGCGELNIVVFVGWAPHKWRENGSILYRENRFRGLSEKEQGDVMCPHLKDARTFEDADHPRIYFYFNSSWARDSMPAGPRCEYGLGI